MHTAEKRTTAGKAPALQEGSNPFFQPKLSIGAPNDPYEREADQVAESVMRMPATGIFSPAISSVQRSSMEEEDPLQRKCEACEAEEAMEPVQRKCEHCEEEEQGVQRKCAACETEGTLMPKSLVQRDLIDCAMFSEKADKEEVAESEGTAVEAPDQEVQRKCAACEPEEKVQRSSGSPQAADPGFESELNSSKGGGNPLPDETRSFMEDRFDRDFSGVRVHSGSNAASMSNSIQAHAFTHGSDIYFNNGQYSPNSDSGKQLLAHELTHVVQQSGGDLQRKSMVQRSSFYFAPQKKISGSGIHSAVLPLFNKDNTDLFTEVSIPGANKTDVDKGKTGIADFYKSSPQHATIGIKFAEDEPKNLARDSDLRTEIAGYDHAKHSAPKGAGSKPHVRRLDSAPTHIQIGDLKPGYSSESVLGIGQVNNYIGGIHNTRDSINNYLKDPTESDSKTHTQWNVTAAPMGSMTIPTDLRYSVGSGLQKVRNMRLAMFREGDKFARVPDTGMSGSLYVYEEPSGVWSYEWIPDNATAGGNNEVNALVHRLNSSVIPNLTKSQGYSIQPKRVQRHSNVLQRKDEKFSDEKWKKDHYTPWKNDASKLLKDKNKVKEAEVLTGLTHVEKRSGSKVNGMTDEKREQGEGVAKARHWKRFGGFYGWLREKFDVIYVKIKNVVDKVKKKMADFMKKGGGGTPGDWFKAFAQVVFKIFKMVGTWVVTQVMDKLLASFREGLTKNIQLIFLSLLPDDAKKHLAKFCELKKQYSDIIDQKEDEIIKTLFGDKLDLLEKIEALEAKIQMVADIVSIIKWGIRLLACASPPAIGCLWNLVLEALMYLVAKLMGTCWFTKEVYAPIMNKVSILQQFPAEVAAMVVDKANEILPVPEGLGKWFAPVKVDASEFKPDCNESADGSARLTEERRGVLDIVKEPGGEEKMMAAMEMMNKRGAGPWVLLTKDRIEMLKRMMEKVDAQQMKAAAGDKSKPLPEGTEEVMGDVGEYSAKEKGLIKEAADAKQAKAAAEAISKEAQELLNHPKAKEALAKPYPSRDQLKQDMENNINWDNLPRGEGAFVYISGRALLCMKGDEGTREGAYIKYYEAEYKGQKLKMILGVGEAYTMDTVKPGEGISFTFTGASGEHGIKFIIFSKHNAGEYFHPGESSFVGSFFDF